MERQIQKEYTRSVRKIPKSKINGLDSFKDINSREVAVIRYRCKCGTLAKRRITRTG